MWGNRQEVSLVTVCVSGDAEKRARRLIQPLTCASEEMRWHAGVGKSRRACVLLYFHGRVDVCGPPHPNPSALLVILCRGVSVREWVVMETWQRCSPFCCYSSETVSARVSRGQRRCFLDLMETTSLPPKPSPPPQTHWDGLCVRNVSPNLHYALFFLAFVCFSK